MVRGIFMLADYGLGSKYMCRQITHKVFPYGGRTTKRPAPYRLRGVFIFLPDAYGFGTRCFSTSMAHVRTYSAHGFLAKPSGSPGSKPSNCPQRMEPFNAANS